MSAREFQDLVATEGNPDEFKEVYMEAWKQLQGRNKAASRGGVKTLAAFSQVYFNAMQSFELEAIRVRMDCCRN